MRYCGQKLALLLREYPDIHVEFGVGDGLTYIVAERFDAGLRMSKQIFEKMIALAIGPALRMANIESVRGGGFVASRRRL